MVTLLPVSKISGVDKNGDGVFESKSIAGGFAGMVAAARKDSVDLGETRCAVVFDLEGIGRSFVSAYLGFYGEAQDWAHLGTYETHGFRSAGRTATLNDLTISNRLWGPLSQLPIYLDAGPFLRSQLALGARYVGFSIRNVESEGRITLWGAVLTILTPWALPPEYLRGLTVELQPPNPWGLLPSDIPRLTVELKPAPPWGLPLSDVPGLVAELQARLSERERDASRPASPMAQLLQAVWIRELAASMTEPGARSIQQAALEMIGRIAADEISRLGREEP